ncbi:hypothetical protein MMC12_007154 [Toensbergia leucococca]|nr:hypothetical protein [Toensbergia leucococca]
MKERLVDAVHPMNLHPLFLHLSLRNWRWYLNDVRQAIQSIAQKATHSSLKIGGIDYDANFADSQRLAKLCENLRLVQNILDSDVDVGEAAKIHCAELRRIKKGFAQQDRELLTRVRLDLRRVKGFRRTATALLKQAKATSQLLLDYRRVDTLNAHVEELRSLAMTSSLQGEGLRHLTEKTRHDSRYMRILTFMAMAYLPGSLLAVSRIAMNPFISLSCFDKLH